MRPDRGGKLFHAMCDLRFEYEARRIAEGKPSPVADLMASRVAAW